MIKIISTKFSAIIILLLLSIVFNANPTIASDKVKHSPVTEKDVDYILKSVDTENKTLAPEKPETELQAVMAEYMKKLNALELEQQEKLDKIGPVEFSSFDELSQSSQVLILRRNIKKYWECKKKYFNRLDGLLKEYRNETGTGMEYKGRLEGTTTYFLEKLEANYVKDLTAFYDFIIGHHSQMSFSQDGILMQDQQSVDKLNKLWEKAVKSSTELTSAKELIVQTIQESIDEFKKEKASNK